jgi:hypothetical protein
MITPKLLNKFLLLKLIRKTGLKTILKKKRCFILTITWCLMAHIKTYIIYMYLKFFPTFNRVAKNHKNLILKANLYGKILKVHNNSKVYGLRHDKISLISITFNYLSKDIATNVNTDDATDTFAMKLLIVQ